MHDFSKFCFKLHKVDTDILKKYIQADFKIDLVTASWCSYYNQYNQVANKEMSEAYLEPIWTSIIEIFCKNSQQLPCYSSNNVVWKFRGQLCLIWPNKQLLLFYKLFLLQMVSHKSELELVYNCWIDTSDWALLR